MHFQQPTFLWGLLLLILPLLVHLFQFRKFQTLLFPGVFRLKEQLNVAKKQKTVRHWWILLSRLLAIFFLVLAFSMPTCNSNVNKASLNQKVIVVVDCSPSMLLKNDGEILLEKARTAARKIIRNASSNTQFALLANHNQTKQQWIEQRRALELVSDIQISAFPENFTTWYSDIQTLLSDNESSNYIVYVITDNLQDIYEGHKSVDFKKASYNIVELESPKQVNISIDSAYYIDPLLSQNADKRLKVQLHASDKPYNGKINVQLIHDDKIIGSQEATFESISEVETVFNISEKIQGNLKVQIEDESLASDNVLYLHQTSQDHCNVSILGNNIYTNKLIQSQSVFIPTKINAISEDKEISKTILVNEVEQLNSKDLLDIENVATSGKNVVCLAGKDDFRFGQLFGLQGKWMSKKISLGASGFNNDVFKGIFTNEIDQKTQLPFVEAYFQIEKYVGNQDWQTVLTLENGEPILIKRDFGVGAIWLWLSDMTVGTKPLAQSSWFLPIFTQVMLGKILDAKPILGFVNSKLPMSFASNLDFQIEKGGILKMNQSEWVVSLETNDQSLALNTNFPAKSPGFYQLYANAKSSDFIDVALNSRRSEKDLLPISDDLRTEIQDQGVKFVKNSSLNTKLIMAQTDNSLWKLFLWLSVLFFAVEIVLLYLKSQKSSIQSNNI